MPQQIAPNDAPQIWPGVVGFIVAGPCGFVAAMLAAYVIGDRWGDLLTRFSSASVIVLIVFIAAAVSLGFAGVRLAAARRIFLAGVMFGLAAGVLAFGLAIGLMAGSTGHGVVS